jgi:hypothetical protein
MARDAREIHHLPTKTTPRLARTILTKLLLDIKPTYHQSIRCLKSLREEFSYVVTTAI